MKARTLAALLMAATGLTSGLEAGAQSCSPTTIKPYIKVGSGAWSNTSSTTVAAGGTLTLGPQPTSGGSWSYAHPASGRVTLLYFGYTDCPDVCPLTMNDLAVALERLPAAVRDKVWVQFVSTDPHRDTPARLRHWIEAYSPSFRAARAPIDQVIAAAQTYGLFVGRPKVTKGDYQVSHGADLVVLDQHGRAVGLFTELAGWRAYAKAIPALVKEYA